ncbi:MAG: hypothetical protein WCR42_00755 [bacterium]
MKKAITIIALVLIFLLGGNEVKSQYTMNYSISGGLAIMNVIGKNPAALPFVNKEDLHNGNYIFTYGGSFQETQSGFDVNFRMPIDESDKIRIPIGLEYIFFRAKELDRVITGDASHDFLTINKFDLMTLYTGLHYVIFKYPEYDINVYTGFELRATYLGFNTFHGTEIFKDGSTIEHDLNDPKKTDAFRIGTSIKLGGEGRLSKSQNVYANWFFALTALNVIGTEKSRGEFLTPITALETRERTAFTYQIAFQVQYKFTE